MPPESAREKITERFNRWRSSASRRRVLLFGLTGAQTVIAYRYMVEFLPQHGETLLELGISILFAILFAWISLGFWTAFMGFLVLFFRIDRLAITRLEEGMPDPDVSGTRTAIVMPIYNEDVSRVFAGLQAIYRSLKQSDALDHFEFFVLSDTTDPDTWVDEEQAWARFQREEADPQRIHYRRRRVNIKRKTGNIADFCRRWGSDFRYMVVLDADSVMSGHTLLRMVRLMERRREIGILQTAPLTVRRVTLYARIQQFANHVYGPLFAAGLHYWQLGDGYYWGHNAIIRLGPFMKHCGLGRLSGEGPMGGEILSHDFVEAAFMRRAGWEVWLAHELDGSWEESPPTLLDELKRDRRWAQGNLQHLRLVHGWGLRFVHRVMFLYGVMAYGSSLLWLLLLGLSTAEIISQSSQVQVYFQDAPSLFPSWPVWHPEWGLALLASTAALLFVPKILAVVLIAARGPTRRLYGGVRGVVLSMLAEILYSVLLAPVRMLFHAKFVLLTLLGRSVHWGSQSRDDVETGWGEALRHHGPGTALAVVWAGVVLWYSPPFLVWLSPILLALLLAIPVSVLSSRASLGLAARRAGLFVIPSEVALPMELEWVQAQDEELQTCLGGNGMDGFTRAVVDPVVNAVHLALLPRQENRPEGTVRHLRALRENILQAGPAGLSKDDKRDLLYDADSVAWLHAQVWNSTDPEISGRWRLDRLTGSDGEPVPAAS